MAAVHKFSDKRSSPLWMVTTGGVVATLISSLIWLTILMFSRYEYQKGVSALIMKQYDLAWDALRAAENILPDHLAGVLAPRDLFRISLAMGEALYGQASALKNRDLLFEKLEQAHGYIRNAAKLAPSSYMAKYWLARVTRRVEEIFPLIHKGRHNPYSALPLYQAAATLRPSGITVHYEMLRYMASKKITDGFDDLAAYTAQIFPGAYYYLKKEPFYTPALQNRIKDGVLRAAALNITPRTTYAVLSSIYQDEKNFEKAALYYGESLRFNPSSNSSSNFIHLGGLSLQMGDMEQAQTIYLNALKLSQDLKVALDQIYRDYKKVGNLEGFVAIARILGENMRSSESLDLAMVRCRIDMGLYELARAILIRREAAAPSAEVYALMAEVASKVDDWDEMELASQRATVFEPDNVHYWRLFSVSLKKQKKFVQAKEVDARVKALSSNKKNRG